MSLTVRAATVDDVDLLHRFSVDLARYEDEPDAVTSTPQTLARDGFGADPKFAALIAERDGVPVGFALYTFNYSVWTAARGIFIEDIWVVPEARRGGVARALMQALARECLALRQEQIPDDWRTLNARSMLGGSLLGQKKYADAEPLLLARSEEHTSELRH